MNPGARVVDDGPGVRTTPFLGSSTLIRALSAEVAQVWRSDAPLLIVGETGTGKGVLARWIHTASARRAGPFVDVNCASLSKDLFESELYGFERGAFTGATDAKVGLIAAAHRGIMFLDEVGDLDPRVQPRLLKVIEDKRFRRLGSVREQHSDVRFIVASNHDIGELVRERRFRQDLFYRINSLTLTCPPLRKRAEDIPAVIDHLLASVARDPRGRAVAMAPDALDAALSYPWPGNLRELRHVIERAAIVCGDGVITAADLRLGTDVRPGGAVRHGDDVLTLQAVQNRHITSVLEGEGWNVERAAQHALPEDQDLPTGRGAVLACELSGARAGSPLSVKS